MTDYVFLDIPMSAGSSLRANFIHVFGWKKVTEQIAPDQFGAPERIDAASRQRIVIGNLSRDDVEPHFFDRAWLTILREPTERCISTYHFFRTRNPDDHEKFKKAHDLNILDYFNEPQALHLRDCSNRAVRQLGAHVLRFDANLREATENAKRTLLRCKWIGFFDTLAHNYQRLRQFEDFQHLPDLQPEATSEEPAATQAVDPALYARLAALNAYDLELYFWAKERFSS